MLRRTDKFTLPTWIRIPLAAGTTLAALPIFSKIVGFSFLPAPDWVARTEAAAIFAGGVMAILAWWVAFKTASRVDAGGFRRTVAIWGTPVVGFLLGKIALVVGVPMMIAIVFGQSVELAFKIESSRSQSRRCPVPIFIADMPFFFNRLCLPFPGGKYYQPGGNILVQGRGTERGVFVGTLRGGN
jgi:hypothetical protein